MQVENIECQIAQAQIGNFLAGSGLSPEAMEQLEEHIAGCPNCKTVLNDRRNELKAMLTGQKAVVDFEKIAQEAEATKPKSIATALRKKSLQQMLEPTPEPVKQTPIPQAFAAALSDAASKPAEQPKPAKKPSQVKPLIYSLALAGVLIGMSYFSKNIAELFGPKLAASTTVGAATTPVTPTETTTPDPAPVDPAVKDAASLATASIVTPNESAPETTEPPVPGPADESSATNLTASVATTGTNPVPTPEMEPLVEAPEAVGTSAGALSATQFQSSAPAAPEPTVAPVVKPAVKPAAAKPVVTKSPVKRTVARRVVRKRPVRRVVAKRAAPVRSRGIKVYNP